MWCHEKGEVCYGYMVVYSSVFKIIGLMWFPVGVSGAVSGESVLGRSLVAWCGMVR